MGNKAEHFPEYYKWLEKQERIRARAIKWNHEHKAEIKERRNTAEFRERARILYRIAHPLKPKEAKVKLPKEHKPKTVKASIKLKFNEMNQNIDRFNKSFECINIDNIAKATDEYMSTHNLTKLEMNNKLWIFLKDKFGKDLTEHRYRFLVSALKNHK
jgi:hypothetical protein